MEQTAERRNGRLDDDWEAEGTGGRGEFEELRSHFEARERETRSPTRVPSRSGITGALPGRVNRRSEEVRLFAGLINQERD